jgi:NADPH-dependent curcumin reductase CurA
MPRTHRRIVRASRPDMDAGPENTPVAFLGMLAGRNLGKQLVRPA